MRANRLTAAATKLAALALAIAAIPACSGATDNGAEAGAEPIDPAAAVAASDTQAQDVVAPGASDGVDGLGDGSSEPESAESGEDDIDPLAIRGEIISEYNLVQGECFNRVEGLQAGRRVVITARVDCAEPHFAEVFHTFELDVAHPGIFPGDEVTRSFAMRACYDHFEPFVGMSYELSVYELGVFIPNRTNFEDAAARYRGVHCWLYHVDGEALSGSARGTQR